MLNPIDTYLHIDTYWFDTYWIILINIYTSWYILIQIETYGNIWKDIDTHTYTFTYTCACIHSIPLDSIRFHSIPFHHITLVLHYWLVVWNKILGVIHPNWLSYFSRWVETTNQISITDRQTDGRTDGRTDRQTDRQTVVYPLVNQQFAIEHGHLYIVDFPIENGESFHSYVTNYQRVHPIKITILLVKPPLNHH
jgi:hypothetical protein